MAEKKKAVRKPRKKPEPSPLGIHVDSITAPPAESLPILEPLPAEVVAPAACDSLPGPSPIVGCLAAARDAWPKHFWSAVTMILIALGIQSASMFRWAGAIEARVTALESRVEKIEKAVYRP